MVPEGGMVLETIALVSSMIKPLLNPASSIQQPRIVGHMGNSRLAR